MYISPPEATLPRCYIPPTADVWTTCWYRCLCVLIDGSLLSLCYSWCQKAWFFCGKIKALSMVPSKHVSHWKIKTGITTVLLKICEDMEHTSILWPLGPFWSTQHLEHPPNKVQHSKKKKVKGFAFFSFLKDACGSICSLLTGNNWKTILALNSDTAGTQFHTLSSMCLNTSSPPQNCLLFVSLLTPNSVCSCLTKLLFPGNSLFCILNRVC